MTTSRYTEPPKPVYPTRSQKTEHNLDDTLVRIKYNRLIKEIGICQRLGYGSGCDCLNECYIVRQHLDTKYE